MNKKLALSFGLACMTLGFSAPATAQNDVALSSDVKVERTTVENGQSRTTLAAPEGVVPGDRLLFTTSYANGGSAAAENFVVTNPLPSAVRLSELDDSFEVSVDGGETFATLDRLAVPDSDAGRRPAELSDVTHIRWVLAQVAPGESGELSYYGIVR
jgi:uncharacterized repeat protein (TIGR01451 family)